MFRAFSGRVPWRTSGSVGEAEGWAAPQQRLVFECPAGHEFEVPFALDAELPDTWDCRHHGQESPLLTALSQPKAVKPPRTHWDMLLERRSTEELEALLNEALCKLRSERRSI
jgi:RNA polymerase-binding protein